MPIATTNEATIASQPGPLDRLSALLRARQLDEALARGAPPETAAPLALRARRLTSLSRRRLIADGLRRVIRDTRRGPPRPKTKIPPRLSQVIAARDELTRLANDLATPGPVAAHGVAQAWILLTDGTGPLHTNSPVNLRAGATNAANDLRLEN